MFLYVDVREPKEMLQMFKRRGIVARMKRLKIADYFFVDKKGRKHAFERKTTEDLARSTRDRSIWHQLKSMRNGIDVPIIIFEHDTPYHRLWTRMGTNALLAVLLSIQVDFKIPIMVTDDKRETVDFIVGQIKSSGSDKSKTKLYSERLKPARMTKSERQRFILEGFAGIGAERAHKLLMKHGKLIDVFNAKELSVLPKRVADDVKDILWGKYIVKRGRGASKKVSKES
jgi:ERCC4-type nuclease